jgi:uncharacterized membrane protein YgcG
MGPSPVVRSRQRTTALMLLVWMMTQVSVMMMLMNVGCFVSVDAAAMESSTAEGSGSIEQKRRRALAATVRYDYPKYTPEILNTTISYRQNVCDRHEAFYNGTVKLGNALEGLRLRPYFLGGIGSYSITRSDGSIPNDSLQPAIRILDALADRAGFIWRQSYGSSDYSTITNTTSTTTDEEQEKDSEEKPSIDEILQWSIETFDLLAMDVVKTQVRASRGHSFVEGYRDASIIMIGTTDSHSTLGLLTFLAPFDWQVWLLTIFTFVMAGLGYQWMEWINDGDSDVQALYNSPSQTFYYSAMAFTGDCKFEPRTNYARVFVFTIAFWGLILCSAYTGSLASFLVAQNIPGLLVETVGDAVAANFPLCVVKGSAMETEIRHTYPQANLITVPPERSNEIFTKVIDGNGECTLAVTTMEVWDIAKIDGKINPDCKLRWIGRTFKFAKSGFVTYMDSGTLCSNLIRDVLSVHISEMIDDGTMKSILDAYIKSRKSNTCSDGGSTSDNGSLSSSSSGGGGDDSSTGSSSDGTQSLSVVDLGGLFIVVYLVWFIACVTATINWYFERRKKERKKVKFNSSNSNGNDIDHRQLRLNDSNSRIQEEEKDPELSLKNTTTATTTDVITPSSERDQKLAFQLESMRRQMDEMQTLLLLLSQK